MKKLGMAKFLKAANEVKQEVKTEKVKRRRYLKTYRASQKKKSSPTDENQSWVADSTMLESELENKKYWVRKHLL